MEEIEESSYIHYTSEQREAEGTEHRYEIAEKLLSKLPESERTVVTLHYLGEMTAKEISKFLGVSVNTITNRLWRARKRLREDQENLRSGSARRRAVPHQPIREHHATSHRSETDTASSRETAAPVGCFWYRHPPGCLAVRRGPTNTSPDFRDRIVSKRYPNPRLNLLTPLSFSMSIQNPMYGTR